MSFHQYDPSDQILSFRGILINGGYEAGTFIDAERAEDGFKMKVGATGDVTRVRMRNVTGSLTLTLQAADPVNDLLSAVVAEDELFGTGTGVLFMKDLRGTTTVDAPVAWVRKLPKIERADDASPTVWVFDCAQMFINAGGSNF